MFTGSAPDRPQRAAHVPTVSWKGTAILRELCRSACACASLPGFARVPPHRALACLQSQNSARSNTPNRALRHKTRSARLRTLERAKKTPFPRTTSARSVFVAVDLHELEQWARLFKNFLPEVDTTSPPIGIPQWKMIECPFLVKRCVLVRSTPTPPPPREQMFFACAIVFIPHRPRDDLQCVCRRSRCFCTWHFEGAGLERRMRVRDTRKCLERPCETGRERERERETNELRHNKKIT